MSWDDIIKSVGKVKKNMTYFFFFAGSYTRIVSLKLTLQTGVNEFRNVGEYFRSTGQRGDAAKN